MSSIIFITIGLLATHRTVKKPTMIKFQFDRETDGANSPVIVRAISGNNLSAIDSIGKRKISAKEYDDMPRDITGTPQWRFAAELLHIELCE